MSRCQKNITVVFINQTVIDDYDLDFLTNDRDVNLISIDEWQKSLKHSKAFQDENAIIGVFNSGERTAFEVDVLHFLKKRYKQFSILQLTEEKLRNVLKEIMQSASISFIERYSSFEEITSCVKRINNNAYYLAPSLFQLMYDHVTTRPENKQLNLTSRQDEILNLLSKGKTYKVIADELFISANTVRFHLKKIYLKLGVSNKSQAVSKYISNKKMAKIL